MKFYKNPYNHFIENVKKREDRKSRNTQNSAVGSPVYITRKYEV